MVSGKLINFRPDKLAMILSASGEYHAVTLLHDLGCI